MNSIFVIGDALLAKCYELAKQELKCLNFNIQNVHCFWETDIQQIKLVEGKYKELFSKEGKPDVVVLLCGSYDLLLNRNPKNVADKIRGLTQHILSTGVKYIIVCSVIDRYEDKEPCEVNKLVKQTNRLVAKNYKDNEHVYFTNVRPSGKPNDLWDIESSNLKQEGYIHIYERIRTVIHKSIISNISPVAEDVPPKSATECTNKNMTENSEKPSTSITLLGDVPIAKRMAEFKDVLITDYKRICTEEKRLTVQLNEIQKEIEETQKQKMQIATTYEKLFSTEISLS